MVAAPLVAMQRIGNFAVLLAFIQSYLLKNTAFAIVIDLPTINPRRSTLSTTLERIQHSAAVATTIQQVPSSTILTRTNQQFRVRKTESSDIDAISTMLAAASISTTELSGWKRGIEMLRVKSSLEKQLHHRLNAVEEGRNTMARYKNVGYSTNISEECSVDSELCHLLWSNDNFRDKLQIAVSMSSERNAWDGHNFDLTPCDPSIFNHAMLTVVQPLNNHKRTDDVVGFCEVALLPCPKSCYDITMECAPSIVNLVTSLSHRRKGIASRLIDVASRYARTQWATSQNESRLNGRRIGLGLYVHPENESAINLYERKGFRVEGESADGLLYMIMLA